LSVFGDNVIKGILYLVVGCFFTMVAMKPCFFKISFCAGLNQYLCKVK